MGMPNLAKTWTREQVLALPDDGNRNELASLISSSCPRSPAGGPRGGKSAGSRF